MRDAERSLLRWAVAAAAIFAFVNVFVWSQTIPAKDAPDEDAHFKVVDFEARHHRIPIVGVDHPAATVHLSKDGFRYPYYTYSAEPGLSYIISAALVSFTGAEGDAAYLVARLPGPFYAAIFVLIAFYAARRMFPRDERIAILVACLAATWPQVAFVFSYVNNDGLAIVAASALIASWYPGIERKWPLRSIVITSALAGFALVNKPNAVAVIVATFFVWALTYRNWRQLPRDLFASALSVAAVAGWWYVIAFNRYGFDVFALAQSNRRLRELHAFWPSARNYGFTFAETIYRYFPRAASSWILGVARSGFGIFGTMNRLLPAFEYQLASTLYLLAAAGLVVRLITWLRHRGVPVEWRGIAAANAGLVVSIVASAFISIYRSYAFDFQAQGRHLFPSILPFLAIFAFGIVGLAHHRRGRALIALGVTICMIESIVLAFLVTLVDSYFASFGGWFGARPLLHSLWTASALLLVYIHLRFWIRANGEESRAEDESSSSR